MLRSNGPATSVDKGCPRRPNHETRRSRYGALFTRGSEKKLRGSSPVAGPAGSPPQFNPQITRPPAEFSTNLLVGELTASAHSSSSLTGLTISVTLPCPPRLTIAAFWKYFQAQSDPQLCHSFHELPR